MKNKEITIYELMGLIKDGKAPKKIKYDDIIWEYSDVDYNYHSTTCVLNYEYILNILKILNDKVEILSKENDEWEDIEKLDKDHEYLFGTINCILNKIIKNQKYLKEKFEDNTYFKSKVEFTNYIDEYLKEKVKSKDEDL